MKVNFKRIERFAAWRSGGFRSTYLQFSTNVYLKTECSMLALNPPFCQTAVLVAQPKILKINFVNIITKFYITI
jgi:hypothetical protein